MVAEVPGALDLARNATAMVLARPAAPAYGDTGVFRAKMLASYARAAHNDTAFFCQHVSDVFARQLNVTYADPTVFQQGLVQAPAPGAPCYGFTDSIRKTGAVLFCSLLHYDALVELAGLAQAWQCPGAPVAAMRAVAADIAAAITAGPLWNPSLGMFRPDTGTANGLTDVWGSAFAAHLGVATPVQQQSVAQWLAANQAVVFQTGQVRHLPAPSHWPPGAPLFVDEGEWEQYQNGGFWATPAAWVLPVVARANATLASALVSSLAVEATGPDGLCEWVNHNLCASCRGPATFGQPGLQPYPTHGDLRGTRHYGASIASAYAAALRVSNTGREGQ